MTTRCVERSTRTWISPKLGLLFHRGEACRSGRRCRQNCFGDLSHVLTKTKFDIRALCSASGNVQAIWLEFEVDDVARATAALDGAASCRPPGPPTFRPPGGQVFRLAKNG
jgi:hypothetical protein